MNLVRLRNGKARLVLGIVAGLVILILTYIMHDTHSKLMATRVLAQDCEHKQDSLSAQLQGNEKILLINSSNRPSLSLYLQLLTSHGCATR